MNLLRMDHVGITVADLDGAIAFFTTLGLELQGTGSVEGRDVDRIVGLEGVVSDIAMLRTPDGHVTIELSRFASPPLQAGDPEALVNTPGLRHLCFAVDDLDAAVGGLQAHGAELVGEVVSFGNSYKLCYLRGPDGIIVELAEKIG
jgi:catechol 2,3-dioxygenase-like lactoylglutathione lyase family enzyme